MSTTTKKAAAPAKPASVRDGRNPPFTWASHAAIAALHAEFSGADRKTAMAMYLGMTIRASLEFAPTGHGAFEAGNADVGDSAGLEARTVERYAPRFERAGLLIRECRPGRKSIWILVEPEEPPTQSRTSAGPTTDSESVVDGADHRHGVAPPPTQSRTTTDTESEVAYTRERDPGEEKKNEEPPQPPVGEDTPKRPTGGRRRDHERYRQRLREQAGSCCLDPGSPPLSAESEWAQLVPEIQEVLGAENFELWLSKAHAHAGEHSELLLAVPEPVYGWVRDRFAPAINQVAKRRLEIVVCEETR